MNRRLQYLPWILLSVVLMPVCMVDAQATYYLDDAVSDVAAQLAQHFPQVQGEVVELRGEQVFLSLGARDQVLEGMRLNVFREGEALISPTTGETLGRLEENLGWAAITVVAETYAEARFEGVVDAGGVRPGDKVRITSGRLPLGVLPVGNQTGRPMSLTGLAAELRASLNATGRFQAMPTAQLVVWLLDRGLLPDDVLKPDVMAEAATAMGVTYFVRPVLRDAGGTAVLEVPLYVVDLPLTPVTTALALLSKAMPTGQRPSSLPAPQPPAVVAAPPIRPQTPSAAINEEPSGQMGNPATLQNLLISDPVALEKRYEPLAQFQDELRGFDAADVDGDGQSEVVLLSETKVFVYRVQESQLVSLASYSDRRAGTLLSAQLVRIGDEQVPGVVVNRYSPGRNGMDSFLLLLEDNRLVRKQKSLLDILLAVDTNGDGVNESIWGQRFDSRSFFRRGQVRQYELRNGRLKRQGKLSLPGGFRATGVALARLGAAESRQLVFVDEGRNLQVYDGRNRRWTSPKGVGGSYVSAALEVRYNPMVADHARFEFEAIPAVADFDGDGIDEVLVPQNQAQFGVVPNLNLYSGGHVAMMRQTPQGFTLSQISPGFDGVVSGVAVLKDRIPGILVAVSRREGVLKQKKQTILYLNRL